METCRSWRRSGELEKPMGMAIASWPARVLGCDLEAGEFSGAAILLLA